MEPEKFMKLLSRLEIVTERLEGYAGNVSKPVLNGHSIPEVAEEIPASVIAFDELINSSGKKFFELSSSVGGDVKTIAEFVRKSLNLERDFLMEACQCIQPTQSFKEKNRKSEHFNHLSAISESIGALGWIAVQPAPAPYVKEMADSAQFYTNRVLKDYKEKDQNHCNWAKSWIHLLSELQAYVKQNHTTGVTWNITKKSKVFDALNVGNSSGALSNSAPHLSGGCAPPPPPPPPPAIFDISKELNQEKKSVSATDALFAEISKGEGITKGLKKVTDDQKTHKNPSLKASSFIPAKVEEKPTINKKAQAVVIEKPPMMELQDKLWRVENFNKKHDLLIDQTDLKHAVYMYKCKECTIIIKGKISSITLDNCTKVALIFDDILSKVDFVYCRDVQMQVIGRVPVISIEKSDGCQIYLNKTTLDVEIISSQSVAMNIYVPKDEEGDYDELPVPQQFKTCVSLPNRALITVPTESA